VKIAKEMALYTSLETDKDRLIYETLFHQMIGTLVRYFSPESKKNQESSISGKNNTVSQIVNFLEKHYQEKITLENLVNVTGYNKSYISQIMKQALGINYYEYLTRIRIREAIFELTNTNEKISEIAYKSGFSDLKAFNTAFKDRFGKTPSQYRKMLVMKHKVQNSGERVYIDLDAYNSFLKVNNSGDTTDTSNFDKSSNDLYTSLESEVTCLEDTLKETLLKVDNLKKQLSKIL
jgi:AraC-like DNA-binding protein